MSEKIYFLHGLNHPRNFPPVLEICDLLARQWPDFEVVNLEIPGYEEGRPNKYTVSEMVYELRDQVEGGANIAIGHSFGALLLAAVSLYKPLDSLVLLQPWFQTYRALEETDFPIPAWNTLTRKLIRDGVEGLLETVPEPLIDFQVLSPRGLTAAQVTENPDLYEKWKFNSVYPLKFYKRVLYWQKRARRDRLRARKVFGILATHDLAVDNEIVENFHQMDQLKYMEGLHQVCYDYPEQTVEMIGSFLGKKGRG